MAQKKRTYTSRPDRLAATLALDEEVRHVHMVSPARAQALKHLGISTLRDLLTHYPRRYIDMSSKETVASARIGSQCSIEGRIHELKLKRPKPKLSLVEITLVDNTSALMITAFRQPWLMNTLAVDMRVVVAGTLEFNYGFKRMVNPFIEPLNDESQVGEGIIIPLHPATEKLSSAWVRRLVGNALEQTQGLLDPLPLELRSKYRLMSRASALRCIHFPHTMQECGEARRRLVYEELLMLQLVLMEEGQARTRGFAPTRHVINGSHLKAMQTALPFKLTDEQMLARSEILAVLAAPSTANHLLLGDVGTGKTVVAAFALAAAADSGSQALFMAPTEVLAQQHAQSLGPLFDASGITWALLSGSTPTTQRKRLVEKMHSGELCVCIGTHALLEQDVAPVNLSLVVIDEQQRFGVHQRAKLLAKGKAPDALYLTATPIPRSLALALFGNLSLSYLRKSPHHTAKRQTQVLSKSQRGVAYDAALNALKRKEQVYVVCPLVGASSNQRDIKAQRGSALSLGSSSYSYAALSIESEEDFTSDNVKAAEQEAKFLQAKTFASYHVELLHGRMAAHDKAAVMERFRSGQTQVLVATTVIEVGVDVANATVMIIEDADRFGLSQLHQLRGRVGRAHKPGQVFLVSGSRSKEALSRLSAMESTDDGYELAAFDLSLRREGDILGNRQHGASALKLVNIVRDEKIIEAAHADARELLDEDPLMQQPCHRALGREARLSFNRASEVHGG